MVSSQLLGRMAAHYGWNYVETLTGFKYLARAADDQPGELAFAYEEAIGTCPAPHVVADKDGIATALVAAQWVAELKEAGRGLLDELAELEATHGVFRTGQVSVRFASSELAAATVDNVRSTPPSQLAGMAITAGEIVDSAGQSTTGVKLTGSRGETSIRVLARPSGTEPKAKFYLEAIGPAGAGSEVDELLAKLEKEVRALASETVPTCLLYTSPSPRDATLSRMPSSA